VTSGSKTAGGTGQSSQQNGSHPGKQQGSNPQAQQPVSTAPATGSQTAEHGGGGSSPLVPILIAVAVLAAISIGAVVLRQRRTPSAPVSPNAN
jgi:hypothetical protein